MRLIDDGVSTISSSRIRELLAAGELDQANALLGYHWFLEGEVATGDKRGRELGFPTANVPSPPNFDLAQGVYAVRGQVDGRLVDGVASYGKPMFDNRRPPFESFFFDFSDDIYGRRLSVALLGRIRGVEVFSGLPELIAAMDRDSSKARRITAAAAPLSELDQRLGFFG
jgi:riboflavin kinase/FMN adenylyltransferase